MRCCNDIDWRGARSGREAGVVILCHHILYQLNVNRYK
jgi:hypothetical protein